MLHESRWCQEQVEAAAIGVEMKVHECSFAAELATSVVEGGWAKGPELAVCRYIENIDCVTADGKDVDLVS